MPDNPCVSNKISKLIGEGYEQSQAQAIAINMCEKSLSPEDEATWLRNFSEYLPRVKDFERTMMLADGAVARLNRGLAVKAANGKVYVEGWAMLFSDAERLDLQDTYFPPDVETLLEYYKEAPLFWEHGNGDMPVGRRSSYKLYPGVGIWLEHELDATHPRYKQTLADIEAGRLSYSTDSMSHYVEEGFNPQDGELAVWPLAGASLTRQPAEIGLSRVRLKQSTSELNTAAGRSVSINEPDLPLATTIGNGVTMEVKTASTVTGVTAGTQDNETSHTDNNKELTNMNPEQIQALVSALSQALGVEPTLEAVMAALQQFMAAVGGETEDAAMSYDPAAIRSALGLEADADDNAVKEAMSQFIVALEPEPMRSVNTEALATARGLVASAAKSAPVIDAGVPYQTSSGKKSWSQVHINTGAPKPTLGSLVAAIVSGDRKGILNATKSGSAKTAQGATENVLGAYLLSETVSESIIEPLYNELMLAKLGVETFTIDTETFTARKNNGGSAAYWLGEHETTTESNVNFGVINFALKEVGALNRYSAKLFRRAAQIEQTVTEDMRRQIALAIDLAGLRGTGGKPAGTGHTGAEPRGLRNTLPSGQITSLGTNGAAPAISNINAAIARIKARNIMSADSWGIAVSTRENQYISGWTDTTGRPLMRQQWDGEPFPKLLGLRVEESNQIPTNITTGSNTDTSEIYIGDWQYAAVAMGVNMEVAVSNEAYFTTRDIAVRVIAEADFGVYYGEAFEILTGSRGIVT
jgi:HK97 family phage major capsid protein